MNGEPTVIPRQPPESGLQEPTVPPCAEYFEEAIQEEDPNKRRRYLQLATVEAVGAKVHSQCRQCLEPEGLIRCPLKFRSEPKPSEEPDVSLRVNSAPFTILADLDSLDLAIYKEVKDRVLRRLKKKVPIIATLDTELRGFFSEIGYPQPDQTIISDEIGSPKSDKPISPLEVVADPRPPEGRETDILKSRESPRPRCARTLARFLTLRYDAEKKWKLRNSGKTAEEITPFNHQPTLELYKSAVIASDDASPTEDCSNCLKETCPLRNGVKAADYYFATSQKVQIPGTEVSIKTRARIINRLDGLNEEEMVGPPDPRLVSELIYQQQDALIREAI